MILNYSMLLRKLLKDPPTLFSLIDEFSQFRKNQTNTKHSSTLDTKALLNLASSLTIFDQFNEHQLSNILNIELENCKRIESSCSLFFVQLTEISQDNISNQLNKYL